MEYEALVREYIELITLIIEAVGQKLGNKKYQQVREIIKQNHDNIEKSIEDEDEFVILINHIIISLLVEIHDIKNLSGRENVEKLNSLIDDFYLRYLEKPTTIFLKKYGMKTIKKPSEYGTSVIIGMEDTRHGNRE